MVYALAAPDQLEDAWRVMLRHVDDRKLLELLRTVARAALTGGAITGDQHAKIVELLA